MYVYNLFSLLGMADTMTSWNTDLSCWDNVRSIYCGVSRCYIGATDVLSELNIKECRYRLMQVLLEKSNIVQNSYEES
jgi:hypothetical protein